MQNTDRAEYRFEFGFTLTEIVKELKLLILIKLYQLHEKIPVEDIVV